jgi:PhzF family phenazine biosynthesis protein
MTTVDLWVAFSETTAGGSAAGIVHDPAGLTADDMQDLAAKVGAPATCFVQAVKPDRVDVRFFSTLTEYGMCGHGTVALLTALIDAGRIDCGPHDRVVELATPTSTATMSMHLRTDGRPEVMLSLEPASFRPTRITPEELAAALGTTTQAFGSPPIEESPSDFVHLIVPTTGLDALASMTPDFERLADLCRAHGVHTVAAFSPTPGDLANTIRVRDFCPATGTDEAPATGTTNRAVACYLARHNTHGLGVSSHYTVRAEQGVEMGRASLVTTAMDVSNGAVTSISVGGVATLLQQAADCGV